MQSWLVARRGEKLPSPADLIDTVRDVIADLGLTIIIEPVRRPCAWGIKTLYELCSCWPGS